MDEQVCPKCKTTSYRNPQMRLLVNVCGHNLCESCVDLLFAKGSGACPECALPLRRNNFRFQLFEDAAVDREVDIRRRVLRDFNKREEDFDSLREYNDYLEMVEDVVFNLTNNIDVLETNARIAEYKEKNKESISKNRHRVSKEQLELEGLLMEEAKMSQSREAETKREAEEEKMLKEKSREKLIEDLMFSADGGEDGDAAAIVARHAQEEQDRIAQLRRPKFSTGVEVGPGGPQGEMQVVGASAAVADGVPYTYSHPAYDVDGPAPPDGTAHLGFMRQPTDSERPAGFHQALPCSRALSEAMAGLFFGAFRGGVA